MITPEQKAQFHTKGFLIYPEAISENFCDELKNEAAKLVDDFKPEEGRTIFSTKSHAHAQADYFLGSGEQVRFFFEEDSFDESGELKFSKHQAINKIGHGMHDLNPVFDRFSRQKVIRDIVEGLELFDNPGIIQSMYIFKQALIGGEVGLHQDSTFLHSEDFKLLGMWIALDDASEENGCLWGLPGTYTGEPAQLFCRHPEPNSIHPEGSRGIPLREVPVDRTYFTTSQPITSCDEDRLVPLPVKKGSIVVFSGLFPHMSKKNTSNNPRNAYTLHFIEADRPYPKTNWLQRTSLLRGFAID